MITAVRCCRPMPRAGASRPINRAAPAATPGRSVSSAVKGTPVVAALVAMRSASLSRTQATEAPMATS